MSIKILILRSVTYLNPLNLEKKRPINIRFFNNYVTLTDEQLSQARDYPSILPQLPKDIAVPFTNQN